MSDILETVVSQAVTPESTQTPGEAQTTTQQNTDGNAQPQGQTQEGRKSYGDWRDQIPKTLWDKVDRDQLPAKLGEYLETNLSTKTAMAELEKLKSTAIIPPDEGADEAAWQDYWKRLGRPESPEGYEFTRGEGDGKNDALDAEMRKLYHEAGLTKTQGEKLFRKLLDYGKTTLAKVQQIEAQATKAAEEALRTEWGRDYDVKRDAAMKYVEKVFGPETMAGVVKGGLQNDKNFMNGLLSLSKALSEDTFVDGLTANPSGRPGVNQYDWDKKSGR